MFAVARPSRRRTTRLAPKIAAVFQPEEYGGHLRQEYGIVPSTVISRRPHQDELFRRWLRLAAERKARVRVVCTRDQCKASRYRI